MIPLAAGGRDYQVVETRGRVPRGAAEKSSATESPLQAICLNGVRRPLWRVKCTFGRTPSARPARAGDRWIERGLVGGHVLRYAPRRTDRASEERGGRSQVAGSRQPAIEHLAILVDATVQVVPLAQDLHVRLVHQPRRAQWLPAPADLLGQSWPELRSSWPSRVRSDDEHRGHEDVLATLRDHPIPGQWRRTIKRARAGCCDVGPRRGDRRQWSSSRETPGGCSIRA